MSTKAKEIIEATNPVQFSLHSNEAAVVAA